MSNSKIVHDAYYVSPDGRTLIILGGKRVDFFTMIKECRRADIHPREWMSAIRQRVSYWEFEDLVKTYLGGA